MMNKSKGICLVIGMMGTLAVADDIGHGSGGYYPLQPPEETCEGVIDCALESMGDWFESGDDEVSEQG